MHHESPPSQPFYGPFMHHETEENTTASTESAIYIT